MKRLRCHFNVSAPSDATFLLRILTAFLEFHSHSHPLLSSTATSTYISVTQSFSFHCKAQGSPWAPQPPAAGNWSTGSQGHTSAQRGLKMALILTQTSCFDFSIPDLLSILYSSTLRYLKLILKFVSHFFYCLLLIMSGADMILSGLQMLASAPPFIREGGSPR